MRTGDTGIVTSYSLIVIARANRRKSDPHWWITAVNVDIPPRGVHGLACKKLIYLCENVLQIILSNHDDSL